MTDPLAERKARGAFLTPHEISDYITEWAVRSAGDRVMEPSCGEAVFLLSAASRKEALGAGLLSGEGLHGIELHAPSADTARELLSANGYSAKIKVGDFFDFDPVSGFDAVVGNPPYVRYQGFSGESRSKALEAALQAGVRLTGLASSWAAFVVQSSRYLKADGRLGLVLPAELLSVRYAAEVRRFLLERFAEIRLIMFEELVFPGVQEEVVLLLAEGSGGSSHFRVYQARGLEDLESIDSRQWTSFAPSTEGKWTPALLSPPELDSYLSVTGSGAFGCLSDWGETYLGCVTGRNQFFALKASEVRDLGLSEQELERVSPPGSRHLRGLTFSRRAWNELVERDRPCYLFNPSDEPSPAAREYIAHGERSGVHEGYKCRNRTPWWRVPLVERPDIFLTYMDRERPRLATNRARVHILNSLYGIRLRRSHRKLGMDLLPIVSLNSATLLGAEMVGRAYGGGLLKLEPTEAAKLPLPTPSLIESQAGALRALRPQLSVALRQSRLDEAVRLVDRIVLTTGLGLTKREIDRLREARDLLFGRRDARSGGTR